MFLHGPVFQGRFCEGSGPGTNLRPPWWAHSQQNLPANIDFGYRVSHRTCPASACPTVCRFWMVNHGALWQHSKDGSTEPCIKWQDKARAVSAHGSTSEFPTQTSKLLDAMPSVVGHTESNCDQIAKLSMFTLYTRGWGSGSVCIIPAMLASPFFSTHVCPCPQNWLYTELLDHWGSGPVDDTCNPALICPIDLFLSANTHTSK